jgi:hypothetical protein
MNVQPINLGDELRQGVHFCLDRSGHLVALIRLRNSVRSASGKVIRNGRIASLSCACGVRGWVATLRVHVTDRRWAFLAPLAALFLSDIVLGFHPLVPWVYRKDEPGRN